MLADEHRLVIHGDGDPQISSHQFVSRPTRFLDFFLPRSAEQKVFEYVTDLYCRLIWQSCGGESISRIFKVLATAVHVFNSPTIPYTTAYIVVHHDTVDLQYRREACLFRREVPSLVACLEILQVVVFLEGFRTSLGEKEAVAST